MINQAEKKFKILMVEDNPEFVNIMKRLLSKHFEVLSVGDGEQGVRIAQIELPDAILMDLRMPKMDGMTACSLLKKNEATKNIPIIVLSADGDDEQTQIKALNAGVDDIVSKPCKTEALIARIVNKIQKTKEKEKTSIVVGNLTLDAEKLEAVLDGKKIDLTALEFDLLKYFALNVDVVLNREKILNVVWHDTTVTGRTVDTHMNGLRKKLKGFDYEFHTIYGAGYVLKECEKRMAA